MTNRLRRLTLGIFLSSFSIAHAEGGLLGAGARYSNVVGMQGALQNRASANQLYRQAMRDERESRRTHDHGLHKKAVREAQQARQADGQGRAFARAALQAFAATMLAGQVKQSEAKDVDVEQLRQIANQPNALEQELASLMDETELDANETGEATFTAEAEDPKPAAESKVEASKVEKKSAREPASTVAINPGPGAPGAALGGTSPTASAPAPTTQPQTLAPRVIGVAVESAGAPPSRAERADQIERDRKVFLKKLGVGKVPPNEVRADKEADIFDVIHVRYQTMRGENSFMEYLEHPELAARVNGAFGR